MCVLKMSKYNLIPTLVSIENVIGVYRNYEFLSGTKKYLAKLHILIETWLILTVHICFIISGFDGFYTRPEHVFHVFNHLYNFTSSVYSLAVVILSFCKSNAFKKFTLSINAVQKLFEGSVLHQKTFQKQRTRFFIHVTLFTVLSFVLLINFYIESQIIITSTITLLEFPVVIFQETLYFMEDFVFFQFIEIVVAILKYLNDAVLVVVEKIRKESATGNGKELRDIRIEIENWDKAIQLLVAANDHLSNCFGIQITLSFGKALVFYIILFYEGISCLINEKLLTFVHFRNCLISLCCHILVKTVVVIAGQRAQNEAKKLNAKLTALRCLLIKSEKATECARAAAGLARRLRAAPLRVRLLSPLAVQMALLADILALVANYTITLLQFNHVL